MGIFDALGDAAGAVGDFAGDAVDFVLPSTDRRGAGLGVADLVNGLGDAVANTAIGGIAQLPDLFNSDVDLSEKLLLGGLVAGGAFMGGRQLAAARRVEQALTPNPVRAMRPQGGLFDRLGLSQRFSPGTAEGEALVRQHPGIKARTADILGAEDDITTGEVLTGLVDREEIGYAGGLISTYGARLADIPPEGQLAAAQLDWAKVDLAIDSGIIRKGSNAEFVDLWDQFKASPKSLTADQNEALMGYIQQVGDATRGVVDADMTIDPVARISAIDVTPHGTVVHIDAPVDWGYWDVLDANVRNERLKQLNLRALAPRAKETMISLYKMGIANRARFLERTDNWYLNEHNALLKELEKNAEAMPWLDLDKLSAAVSLTSEATDWDLNVQLAMDVLKHVNGDKRLQTPEFQAWLADPASANPADAARFDEIFRAAHKAASATNKLKVEEARKVFRLFSQDGPTVFGTTGGPKQKNFYLNLLDPTNPEPVTIDRHQIDIFMGVATHSDFKVLESRDLGEGAYDILADTLRQAADEVGVMPHRMQGVVWQTWRQLKKEWGPLTHDWSSPRGPFRLHEADGGENLVYELLRGRPHPMATDVYGVTPKNVIYAVGAKGAGVALQPDGTAVIAAHATRETAASLRHLRPAVQRADGVSIWSEGYAVPVADLEAHLKAIDPDIIGAEIERWSAGAWGGVHPAQLPGPTVMIEVPSGGQLPGDLRGRVIDPHERVVRSAPSALPLLEDVAPEDLTYGRFVSPESPLRTRQWAALSAAVDDEQAARFGLEGYDNAARHVELGDRLRRAGYNPIEQRGVYGGEPEPSWLVFGIKPDEAVRFGELYHQDAVVTNDHMWFTKTAKDPKMAGMAQEFDPDEIRVNVADEDFVSITTIEGQEVRWTTAYDPDSPLVKADPKHPALSARRTAQTRLVAVKLSQKDLNDLESAVAKLERNGATVRQVYAPGRPPQGWAAVREHLYTDGVTSAVVRTADNEIASPNGYTAWVRQAEADRLPRKNVHGQRAAKKLLEPSPRADGSSFSFGGLALTDSPTVLTKRTGAFTVDMSAGGVPVLREVPDGAPVEGAIIRRDGRFLLATTEGDISGSVKQVDLLMRLGVKPEKIHLGVGEEAARFDYVPPKASPGQFSSSWSATMPGVRRSGAPVPEWAERYNIEFQPHYRDKATGELLTLPDVYHAEFGAVLDRLHEVPEHAQMLRLVRFKMIGAGSWDDIDPEAVGDDILAWATKSPDVEIGLNARIWTDPDAVTAEVVRGMEAGFYNPTLPNSPGTLLAHEFGHVIHYALRASFRTKGAANQFERDVLQKLKGSVPKKKLKLMVSEYGTTNLEEFMAEVLAEAIFAETPRAFARKVYTTVMDQYRTNAALIPETSILGEVAS